MLSLRLANHLRKDDVVELEKIQIREVCALKLDDVLAASHRAPFVFGEFRASAAEGYAVVGSANLDLVNQVIRQAADSINQLVQERLRRLVFVAHMTSFMPLKLTGWRSAAYVASRLKQQAPGRTQTMPDAAPARSGLTGVRPGLS